jgi:hypothetical protein
MLPEETRRTGYVSFHLTSSDYGKVKAMAKAEDRTMAYMARKLLLAELNRRQSEPETKG